MPAATETRRIIISVDAPGVKQALDNISKSMGAMNKNVSSISRNFSLLRNTFAGYLSSIGIRELARMSDEMQNLSSRLRIVSRAGEDNNVVMQRLLQLADETKQSVGQVGEVYTRLGSSLKSANISSEQLASITKTLINSFRISGSTGNETTATIIQLSQAFASGTLRGQELRSVLLQNAELAKLLRERFGKDLAKQAEAGLISVTKVLEILFQNQDRINKESEKLTITFEQGLTKAINRVQFALFELNREFNLSGKFAQGLDIIVERFTLILTLVGVLALTRLPQLIASIKALSLATIAFARGNPLVLALTALSAVVVFTNKSLGEFVDKLRNVGAWIVFLTAKILELSEKGANRYQKFLEGIGVNTDAMTQRTKERIQTIKELERVADELGAKKFGVDSTQGLAEQNQAEIDKERKKLLDFFRGLEQQNTKALKTRDVLAEINKEFLTGVVTAESYASRLADFQLFKLNKEFKEGRINLLQFNEGLRQIKEQNLARELNSGTLALEDFNDAIRGLKLEELNDQLKAGVITLQQYDAELIKISQKFEPGSALRAGAQDYIESVGTLSQNVANGIRSTFTNLEDSFVEFVKRGKFNFRDFAQAVLDDLTRIIIRASIIQPIANALVGYGTGAAVNSQPGAAYSGSGTLIAAKGYAFDGPNVKKFAKGAIFDSPTSFTYGQGKPGIMGEDGPEAILPLARGPGGSLGVQASVTPVNINIINQSGADIQQTETTGPNGEKTIELLITGKVRDGIINGKFDKAFQQSFGLSRKGF